VLSALIIGMVAYLTITGSDVQGDRAPEAGPAASG
jgi:hypothetical protein